MQSEKLEWIFNGRFCIFKSTSRMGGPATDGRGCNRLGHWIRDGGAETGKAMYHFLKVGCEAERISGLWGWVWFRMYLLVCFSFKERGSFCAEGGGRPGGRLRRASLKRCDRTVSGAERLIALCGSACPARDLASSRHTTKAFLNWRKNNARFFYLNLMVPCSSLGKIAHGSQFWGKILKFYF